MENKTTKKTVRASANTTLSGTSKTLNKKQSKKVEKAIKNTNIATIIIAFICFLVFLAIGAVTTFVVTKNDEFSIVGREEITITVNESYKDEGVFIKEFGFDVSDKVIVETNLTQTENGYSASNEGTYQIVYKATSFKYGILHSCQRIRLVNVVAVSEDIDVDREV